MRQGPAKADQPAFCLRSKFLKQKQKKSYLKKIYK